MSSSVASTDASTASMQLMHGWFARGKRPPYLEGWRQLNLFSPVAEEKLMAGKGTKTPNDDRSDTLNPNNAQNQAALDEHSRRVNPAEPGNAPATTRPSSPPGKGKG